MKIEESSINQSQVEHQETHHPTERISHIETPSESKDQSHLLQQAVVTPQNTYVREKFQNEGKWAKKAPLFDVDLYDYTLLSA